MSVKKFNCPFCDRRDIKDRLIRHIENHHDDLIPEDYNATRLLYDKTHNLNGHGNCIVCGNPTDWNDKTEKYSRLCKNPKCKEKMRENFRKNMIKVYGKDTLLDDPEQQEKMLANRRISGIYRYSDGSKFTYTGQYEKNAIEFMDKVLNLNSQDIIMPGPVIDYTQADGQSRKWITDIYYIPYNLIIEVKDGGSNPNNRYMPEYRQKQYDKEKSIIKLGKYNYLRLTDNDFSQLMNAFATLKDMEINEDDYKDIKFFIKINESGIYDYEPEEDVPMEYRFIKRFVMKQNKDESIPIEYRLIKRLIDEEKKDNTIKNKEDVPTEYEMIQRQLDDMKRWLKEDVMEEHMGVASIGGIPPTSANMMVQYSQYPNCFSGDYAAFGVVDNEKSTKMRVKDDNDKTKIVDKDLELNDKFFTIYKHTKKNLNKENADSLYEQLTGKRLLSIDQIYYDDDFQEVSIDKIDRLGLVDLLESINLSIKKNNNHNNLPLEYMPISSLQEINQANRILKDIDNSSIIMEDNRGYFIIDLDKDIRSKSYKSINEIDVNSYKIMKSNLDDKEVDEINSSGLYRVLNRDYKNSKQLEDDYNKFLSLPMDNRFASNDMSLRIYGKTNEERFNDYIHKFNKSKIKEEDIPVMELSLSDIERSRDYGISMENKDKEIKYLKQWSLYSGIYVILPCDTEDELNDQWTKFNSMDIILMRMSDNKLIEALGCNNETMYNYLKSIFSNKNIDTIYYFNPIESAKIENRHIELPKDLPFYTPGEIKGFKENNTFAVLDKQDRLKTDKWYKEYKNILKGNTNSKTLYEWLTTVRELSYKSINNPNDSYTKQLLLEYGWNPYFEFNESNREKAYNRIMNNLYTIILTKNTINESNFPIQFNKHGDLEFKNFFKKKDYNKAYAECHRLLLQYEKEKNIEGMKYELAKLWYLNLQIESDLYSSNNKSNRKKLLDARARILNDFNKYLSIVLKHDKNFNFTNYYAKTEFSDDKVSIKAPTLKYTLDYLKKIFSLY